MKPDQFDDPKDPYDGLYHRVAYEDLQKRLDLLSKNVRQAYYNANAYPAGTQWNKVPPEVKQRNEMWKKKYEAFDKRLQASYANRSNLIKKRSPLQQSPDEIFGDNIDHEVFGYNLLFDQPIYSDDECPEAEKKLAPFKYAYDYEWMFDDDGDARTMGSPVRGETEKVKGVSITNLEMFHHEHVIKVLKGLVKGQV